MRKSFIALVTFVAAACGPDPYEEFYEDAVQVRIENDTGDEIWVFDYRECGTSTWTFVIDSDEYLAPGDSATSGLLDPGCFELRVEDENGCTSEHDTGGNLDPGLIFTWTVRGQDMNCGLF